MLNRLFKRRGVEHRAAPYTDAIIDAIYSSATGTTLADVSKTAALEIAASIVAKTFSSLEVHTSSTAVTSAITSSVLSCLGRSMIRHGDAVFYIEVDNGIQLIPVASFDIQGGYQESSWVYRLDLWGPSQGSTLNGIASDSVVHCRYSYSALQPWLGVSPLGWSRQTASLHSESLSALLDDTKGPRGTLIPISKDGGSDTLEKLKSGLKTLRGSVALVPGNNVLGEGQGFVRREYETKRLGFDSPATLLEVFNQTAIEVLASCGVPAEITGIAKADGTSKRESYRQYLHLTVTPLVKIVQDELRKKLDAPDLKLDTSALYAADVSGRVRSLKGLIDSGVDLSKAAEVAGLTIDD